MLTHNMPLTVPQKLEFKEVHPYLENTSTGSLFDELTQLIADLGRDGGSITPSIYDTAQVLRLAPPQQGVGAALEWLLLQQKEDGGWGNPLAPLMRDVPTLATVLALRQYNRTGRFNHVIQTGLAFLARQSVQWQDFSPDDLPVGVELILPHLIEEAMDASIEISLQPYRKLIQLGHQKRKIIERLKIVRGTPAAFSWEAWGHHPDPFLLDALGSVGNSTGATAMWIAKMRHLNPKADTSKSEAYLQNASTVTGLDIPGVVPFAWPINRFEQTFGLFALAVADLLKQPALKEALQPQIDDLLCGLSPYGIGFSDQFIPDVDDTAAAITVLEPLGIHVGQQMLKVFKGENGYFTYPGELHASLSAHARAVHALSVYDLASYAEAQNWLLNLQKPNGCWTGDKWHKSWLYTTSHMLFALEKTPYGPSLERSLVALQSAQNPDGGWGLNHHSTPSETAYVLLALAMYQNKWPELETYWRGQKWLAQNIHRSTNPDENLWIGKELYKPRRVDRAFELAAVLQASLHSQQKDTARGNVT